MDARADQDPMFIYGEPECLKWFSGICTHDLTETPYEDRCRASARNEYKSMEDIGVMGWLCSCRLGYTEGTDVLYSTNTFHIRNTMLVQNLEVVSPSKHLARTHSLQLFGFFYLENWPHHHPETVTLYLALDTYDVDAYISWREHEGDPFDPVVDTMEKALGLVDEIVFQKHESLEVEIAISRKVWNELRRRRAGEIASHYPRLSVKPGQDDAKGQQFLRRTIWLEE